MQSGVHWKIDCVVSHLLLVNPGTQHFRGLTKKDTRRHHAEVAKEATARVHGLRQEDGVASRAFLELAENAPRQAEVGIMTSMT